MPQLEKWTVTENSPVHGFSTTTLREILIRNFGPCEVEVVIPGRQNVTVGTGSNTFFLPPPPPGESLLVQVVLVPDDKVAEPRAKGEFQF